MKKSRYSESQIVKILKEVEGGRLVCRLQALYNLSLAEVRAQLLGDDFPIP